MYVYFFFIMGDDVCCCGLGLGVDSALADDGDNTSRIAMMNAEGDIIFVVTTKNIMNPPSGSLQVASGGAGAGRCRWLVGCFDCP